MKKSYLRPRGGQGPHGEVGRRRRPGRPHGRPVVRRPRRLGHADLEGLSRIDRPRPRSEGKSRVVSKSGILTDEEMAKRKLDRGARRTATRSGSSTRRSRCSSGSRSAPRGSPCSTRGKDSVLAAGADRSAVRPRTPDYPNQWRPLLRDEQAEIKPGPAHPFDQRRRLCQDHAAEGAGRRRCSSSATSSTRSPTAGSTASIWCKQKVPRDGPGEGPHLPPQAGAGGGIVGSGARLSNPASAPPSAPLRVAAKPH